MNRHCNQLIALDLSELRYFDFESPIFDSEALPVRSLLSRLPDRSRYGCMELPFNEGDDVRLRINVGRDGDGVELLHRVRERASRCSGTGAPMIFMFLNS